MTPSVPSALPRQLPLALNTAEPPTPPEALLRAAHARCGLTMSFEEAMRHEALRICFRAMARRAIGFKRRVR